MKQLKFIINLTIIFCILIKISDSVPVQKWYKEDDFEPFYIETELKYNWFEAWNECSAKNMTLVAVDTLEKNAALIKILKTKFDDKHSNIWIGGNDLGNSGYFMWYSTGKRFEFTNWSKGNPDHYTELEHCVHYFDRTDFEWNDANCMQKMGFICEENRFLKEMRTNLAVKKNFIDQLFSL
ncbi:lectin subunit alpha-like [Lucilia sericata]|uniref:lectin subunit alpha-like n=1 Tax=Lucilia sericata TaxID=13632 RepID=UPI0018A828DD|nr:lectin subunit alpha-like [Lucilia sericata]